MKGIISGKALSTMAAQVRSVVPKQSVIQGATGILVRLAEGKVSLSGTNYERFMTVSQAAIQVADAGVALVDGVRFAAIAGDLMGLDVAIESTDVALIMKAGGSRYRLSTIPSSDFPDMPVNDGIRALVEAEQFVTAFRQAAGFSDKAGHVVNGNVQVRLAGQRATLCGTNGHRMVSTAVVLQEPVESPAVALVPAGVLGPLAAGLMETQDAVLIFGMNSMEVRGNGVRLSFRLAEGTYPDVDGLLVKIAAQPKRVTINSKTLAQAVRSATLVIAGDVRQVRLDFSEAAGLLVSSYGDKEGQSEITLPLVWTYEPLTTFLSAPYLIDSLALANGNDVELLLENGTGPFAITGAGTPISAIMSLKGQA